MGKTKVWFRHADGRPMSLGEALEKCADLIGIAPQVATVGQLIDEYCRLELPKLKPRTQVDRRIELGSLRAVFAAMGVLEVEPRDVVGYKMRRMAAFVEAGGVRVWDHDIRATAGAEVEEDRGIEDARKLLGHDEQSTTRIYPGRRKVSTVMPNTRKG